MHLLRKILFPFSALYHVITAIRNLLYDLNWKKSTGFSIPVIVVGNLSVGGTGKSPMVEYLIRLLKDRTNLATLSRGYKRKSEGFVLADADATPEKIGDEPFQFHRKFPDVKVAVDANRVNGINQLLQSSDPPDAIILDDAFQHRRVKPGFAILLTPFHDLYCDDFLLPTGNLRESRRGAKRADIIVVTKCPDFVSDEKKSEITRRLKPKPDQSVFFSRVAYDEKVYGENSERNLAEIKNLPKVLVAGIAKPQPFFDHLKNSSDNILEFPDHHDFTTSDLEKIREASEGKIVVTTEKDYVRLKAKWTGDNLYYLPIKSQFLENAAAFDAKILAFASGNK